MARGRDANRILRMKLRIACALLLAATLSLARAAEPIVIKFSHAAGEDTARARAIDYFRSVAETRTHGRVRVEVFHNSTLYGERDELEALQLGAIQMLVAPLVDFSALGARDFDVFELPYVFSDLDAVHRVTEGPVGAQRFRVKYSRVSDAALRAIGASPQPAPISAMYPALQAGHMDGTENPVATVQAEHLDQVQKFLTLSDHGYVGSVLVVNLRFWNRLPGDIRAHLAAAAQEATRMANELARKDADEALAAMRRDGHVTVVALDPAEKARWRAALMPVRREAAQRVTPEVLQSVYRDARSAID